MHSPNIATGKQLELIRDIGDALRDASVEWWLFGAWAMDFHAGEITRDHSDIEIFVWEEDADRVRATLIARGYLAPGGLHPDEGQPFLKEGQEIDTTFLVRAGDDRVCGPGRWSDWLWAPDSFDGPPVTLHGVEARPMSLAGLLAMKEEFAAQPAGGPIREKDREDIAVLRRLISERLATND